MGKANQFILLLWKNWLLQKRKVFVTFLEIGLPVFFAVILIFIRMRVTADIVKEPTTWTSFVADHFPPSLSPNTNGFSTFQSQDVGGKWNLYYSPNNTVTHRIMSRLEQSKLISEAIGFPEEGVMTDKLVKELEACNSSVKCDVLAAIVFTNISYTKNGEVLQYKIRLPSQERTNLPFEFKSSLDWKTRFMFPVFQLIGPRDSKSQYGGEPEYYQQGFLTLQLHIDQSIIKEFTNTTSLEEYKLSLKRTPYPPYNNDNFVLVLQTQYPFILLLSFIFSALNIVKDVVYEKERKLKESMKMMGLNNWLHWAAWFVKYFLFLLISITLMTVFFTIPVGKYGSVIGKTSPLVLLVFLLVYGISVICFSFMISVFFTKANSAAAAGGIIFFLTYIPFFFLQPRYDSLSYGAKIGTCLISNVAMAYGGQVIGMFEGTGAGVQWSNINQGSSVDDNFSLLDVLVMLLFDSILYLLVTWYVEAVKPGEYGLPQPWYFPILKSYWCGVLPKEDFNDEDSETAPLLVSRSSGDSSNQSSGFFEGDPIGLKAGIRIRKLVKEFGSGQTKKVAVNDMSLNMYEGQITALLGHNGAGKTTTMSMLTGFIPPTNGTAFVNGFNIREDIASVRSSLGLCPQHDVLFDSLTVNEHLVFFAKLKGCKGNDVMREVDTMLEAVDLLPKRDALAKTLSGGQKRKLSVGIALVGGSKIVMLDEPTSGMDPNARRQTWDILQRHRQGRTMILTTHFMDEADILGDRIAIMANGELQCCGTSLFLKNKYGAGYHMVMVKATGCDVQKITQLVQNYVPDAKLESNISAELSYVLPHESKGNFEELFTEIEMRKEELRVASYGASVTTMEEVFLRVGEESDESMKGKLNQDVGGTFSSNNRNTTLNSAPLFNRDLEKNSGPALYLQQFLGMLLKRALHTWRNRLVTISQLAVPLFFTIIALIVIKTMPGPEDSPPLTLDMTHFRDNTIVYSSGVNGSSTSLTKALAKAYGAQFQNESWTPEYLNKISDLSLEDYLIKMGDGRIATYTEKYIIAAEFSDQSENNQTKVAATAHFNAQTYHAQAISLNALDNALLRHASNGSNLSISTVNHPLPRTISEQINDQLTKGFEGFSIAINLLFGMSFLASSFVLFLIRERSVRAKHSQFVSGVHSFTFWSATFVWDFINYLLPCFLLLISFAGFNITAYVGNYRFLEILLLFVLYGWAILPFMYNLSFLFSVPSTGLVWLTIFNILSGIATLLAVEILKIPQLNTMEIARVLEWIFLVLLPNFCMGQAMLEFYNNFEYLQICEMPEIKMLCAFGLKNGCCKDNCGDTCLDYQENYLSWEAGGIGRMLVFLAIQGCLYFGILLLLESHTLQKLFYSLRPSEASRYRSLGSEQLVEEDGDVALERQRIVNTPIETLGWTDSLVIRELKKYYGNLLAVDRISVGIPQGECFGLLGINGAGKTSTFKMLTGDEIVSSGNAYLEGYDIKNSIELVQRNLGYCPQFDALIDELTGRETLYMYSRLRGVKESYIPSMVSDLMSALLLDEHADKLVQSYSGGNKRKLSAAVALVGDPPILFLDEPTTGMDPVARRLLWDTLSQVRASGRTLVLTSHSMEECEALCTRIAIMVNGQFKCLGSQQHLKNKFGEGFTVIAKIGYPDGGGEPDVQPLMEYITSTFPGSILKDVHQGMVHYHVTDASISWSRLFGAMEKGKLRFNIEDYLVSQTTLEQVFINFARSQIPPQEKRAGLCTQCCTLLSFCLCSRCCHSCQNGYELAPLVDDEERVPVAIST